MKKIFLALTLFVTIAVSAQKSADAPAAAKAAFAKAYPTATKVRWEKEDGNFEFYNIIPGEYILSMSRRMKDGKLSEAKVPGGILIENDKIIEINLDELKIKD